MHNAGVCISKGIQKVADDVYDITIKYKEGWSKTQREAAKKKVSALSKADTKVIKKPQRKSGTRKTFQKKGGKVKNTEDVDHTIDLQLGGKDEFGNMTALDKSVNRSVGKSINNKIKNLPEEAKIRNINIID